MRSFHSIFYKAGFTVIVGVAKVLPFDVGGTTKIEWVRDYTCEGSENLEVG